MSSASVTVKTLWESYEALKAGDLMVMSGVPPGRLSAAAASCLGGVQSSARPRLTVQQGSVTIRRTQEGV